MKIGKSIKRTVFYVFIIAVLIFYLFPFFWMITTSFKTSLLFYRSPPVWIPPLDFSNWNVIFGTREQALGIFFYLGNSLIVGSISTLGAIALSLPAGYALARFRFRGRNDIGFFFLSLRILPPISIAIPMFLIWRDLGLLDTHLSLIIPYIIMNLPFAIWILTGFFAEIPSELEEAAEVDGCGKASAFVRVVMPLALPGIAATAIFCFISAWNELLFGYVFTRNKAMTVSVFLTTFIQERGIQWGQISAGCIMAIVPVIILALSIQKYLMRAMTLGALKR